MGPVFLEPDVLAYYSPLLRAGASLEGALARPRTLHSYGEVTDLIDLASSLLEAVNRAHAPVDGNKRASIRLTDLFLQQNGLHIEAPDDDIVDLVVSMAAGTASADTSVKDLVAMVRQGPPRSPLRTDTLM